MKTTAAALAASALILNPTALLACPQCRPLVKAEVYDQNFGSNLLLLLLPLGVLLAIVVGLHFSDAIVAHCNRLKHNREAPWHTN